MNHFKLILQLFSIDMKFSYIGLIYSFFYCIKLLRFREECLEKIVFSRVRGEYAYATPISSH